MPRRECAGDRNQARNGRSCGKSATAGAPYFDEEIKFIGVFSTRRNARAAAAYLKSKPGFRKPVGRFFVEQCRLDEVWWNTGYVTWNGSKGKFDPS